MCHRAHPAFRTTSAGDAELQILARACGKADVHDLEPEDMRALTFEASMITGRSEGISARTRSSAAQPADPKASKNAMLIPRPCRVSSTRQCSGDATVTVVPRKRRGIELVLILFALVRGWRHGSLREGAGLLALVVALFAAPFLMVPVTWGITTFTELETNAARLIALLSSLFLVELVLIFSARRKTKEIEISGPRSAISNVMARVPRILPKRCALFQTSVWKG